MNSPVSSTTRRWIEKWVSAIGLISVLALGLVAASTSCQAAGPAGKTDYQRARFDPIHFKPAIEKATDQQCLACHAEVLKPSVRSTSIAGVKANEAKAWYQDVSTYQGAQDTFHRRHLTTEYATKVMQMRCTTCQQFSF